MSMEKLAGEFLGTLYETNLKLEVLQDLKEQGARQEELLRNIAENLHTLTRKLTAAVDVWSDLQSYRLGPD